MSALGWVVGGPPAVVDALQEVLTDDGTLVMPTHTSQYTDPTAWQAPPIPDDWVDQIRESRPPYRPEVTPDARNGFDTGVFPELSRNRSESSSSVFFRGRVGRPTPS